MDKQKVIDFFGGPGRLSDAANIPRQYIYEWGTQVPEQRRPTIKIAVKDELARKTKLAKELLK